MRTLFIVVGMVVPGVAVGLRLGVFDGIAVTALLLGLNQQLIGLTEVIVTCTKALRK